MELYVGVDVSVLCGDWGDVEGNTKPWKVRIAAEIWLILRQNEHQPLQRMCYARSLP